MIAVASQPNEVADMVASGRCRAAEVVNWYLSTPIPHVRLDEFLRLATREELTDADRKLLLAVGPSWVGKSTGLKLARNTINWKHQAEIEANPTLIPASLIALEAPESDEFEFAVLVDAWLENLGEAVLAHGVPPARPGEPQMWVPRHRRTAVPIVERLSFAAKRHGQRVQLIDELTHMTWGRSSAVNRHFNRLKSIATTMGLRLVAAAAYDFLPFLDLNAQLLNRIEIYHFSRYRWADPVERDAFREALDRLLDRLPLPHSGLPSASYFYAHSLGCVGELSRWLAKALESAVETGAARLTPQHLAMHQEPEAVLIKGREIENGERNHILRGGPPDAERWKEHRRALGLTGAGQTRASRPAPDAPKVDLDPADAATRPAPLDSFEMRPRTRPAGRDALELEGGL